ncbi:MAG: hypothetical protein LUE29_03715 [Lachnospiraceae bacterium]|nr:hypothetical protein [Lachnospiraceae bacterium]
MKKFLKRANRGLILGGIILVILVVYLVIDYATFSAQKDDIANVVKGYISEMDALNTDADSFDETKFDDTLAKIQTILETYFCDKSGSQGSYVYTKNKLYTNYQDSKTWVEIQAEGSIITDADFEYTSFSVKKNGPGSAYVTVELTYNYVIEIPSASFNYDDTYGEDDYVMADIGVFGPAGFSFIDPEVSISVLESSETITRNESLTATWYVELYKVDGEWKISNIDGGSYSSIDLYW